MIVKMKFISITGPKNDIDRVTDQYLSKYEIQLENALSELKTTENLQPFVEINPYREALEKAKQLALYVKDQKPEDTPELSEPKLNIAELKNIVQVKIQRTERCKCKQTFS